MSLDHSEYLWVKKLLLLNLSSYIRCYSQLFKMIYIHEGKIKSAFDLFYMLIA